MRDAFGMSQTTPSWSPGLMPRAAPRSRAGTQDTDAPSVSCCPKLPVLRVRSRLNPQGSKHAASLIQKVRAENVFIRCLASRGPHNSGQGKQDRFRVVGASVSFHRNVAPMYSSYQRVSRTSNTERRKASEIRYSNDNTHWPLT